MRVAVVILNWNTEAYLKKFLPGIIDSISTEDGVFVADSGSEDSSLKMLPMSFPTVHAIPLKGNFGFAGGYNRALEKIDAEYFVLLNSDVEVSREWLAPLVHKMEEDPSCAICGPKLLALDRVGEGLFARSFRFEYAGAAGGCLDRMGYPFCYGRLLDKVETDHGQYETPRDVFWVSGACLMIRSGVWKQLGGLDELFFAHMEEIDLCWRAQLAGWKVCVVPQSRVWHLGGGTLSKESPFKLMLNYRNSLYMLQKNLPATIGPRRARIRIFFRMCLDGCCAVIYFLAAKEPFAKAVVNAHNEFKRNRKNLVITRGEGKVAFSPRLLFFELLRKK